MPKVLAYTPAWLSRPSPGHAIFAPKHSTANGIVSKKASSDNSLPKRIIATRDSEIFVAVGTEIRWADLALVQDGVEPVYRTLKVSVPLPITRLVISPGEDYMVISTSHTVHVVHLPDPALLQDDRDSGPIKAKTFQIGPTIHVLEESPVATTLWHPLGYHGRCLTTITKAGVVRLWEVNRADRSSFSEPLLSIDLMKLANATDDTEDLSASKFGESGGFTPDVVDLEVASACFGDFPEQEGVHGWAPMTLWIATVLGDVYALCPLLPSKWQLVEAPGSYTFLQTLTSTINVNYAEVSDDQQAPKGELKMAEKQVAWLADILYQEPFVEQSPRGDYVKVFARPANVPAVPLLQGPFTIAPEVDDFELSDLLVFSLKTLSDGSEDEAAEGVPTAVVCLLTDTCTVHVCLDLQGIVGQWLPSPEDDIPVLDTSTHTLIIAETIPLLPPHLTESSFNQSITPDIHTDFSFFVAHATGTYYVSLEPWICKLEAELSLPQTEGALFRLQRMLETASSTVEQHIKRDTPPAGRYTDEPVTAAVAIEDGNIGYLLLTLIAHEPRAALLDAPDSPLSSLSLDPATPTPQTNLPALQSEPREPWHPPPQLYTPFNLLSTLHPQIPPRHRSLLAQPVRLSPATLELLITLHRILSAQTAALQRGVIEVFSRADRLRVEMRDQVGRVRGLAGNIDDVVGTGGEEDNEGTVGERGASGAAQIEARLERVRRRQEELGARYERLRRRMAGLRSSGGVSEKEERLNGELEIMGSAIGGIEGEDSADGTLSGDAEGEMVAWRRVDRIRESKQTLVKEAEGAIKKWQDGGKDTGGEAKRREISIPARSRQAQNEAVTEMLRRNEVLFDAAADKLRGLGVGVPVAPGERVA